MLSMHASSLYFLTFIFFIYNPTHHIRHSVTSNPPPPGPEKYHLPAFHSACSFLAGLNIKVTHSQCDFCLPPLSMFLSLIWVISLLVHHMLSLHICICGQVKLLERWLGRTRHLRSALSVAPGILWEIL